MRQNERLEASRRDRRVRCSPLRAWMMRLCDDPRVEPYPPLALPALPLLMLGLGSLKPAERFAEID